MLKHSVSNEKFECGTDEAGRGCLAGPVTAAAVILPEGFKNKWLNDSKQLSHKRRLELRPIIEAQALGFAVAHIFPEEIDKINILNASILGMHKAIDQLDKTTFIAVDGNRFKPFGDIPYKTIKMNCIVVFNDLKTGILKCYQGFSCHIGTQAAV